MGNIFLETSYTKCCGETIPRLASKISKLSIFLDQWSKVLCSLFFVVCQVEGYRNILKLSLLLSRMRPFLKAKSGLKRVSLPHFLHDF